jgi:hypothetical protein
VAVGVGVGVGSGALGSIRTHWVMCARRIRKATATVAVGAVPHAPDPEGCERWNVPTTKCWTPRRVLTSFAAHGSRSRLNFSTSAGLPSRSQSGVAFETRLGMLK